MSATAMLGRRRLGVAALGLIVALGSAQAAAEPAAGPRVVTGSQSRLYTL